MLSCHSLKITHPDIWDELELFFNGRSVLPCLFAVASFHKKMMKFIVVEKRSEIVNELIANLPKFNDLINSEENITSKTYSTTILICLEGAGERFDETDFINKFLADLSVQDKYPWPNDKTRNFDDQDFEFYWGGVQWFPVLLHPKHAVEIRRSPFFMIAFQAGKVFDFNKQNRPFFYENMRNVIHGKIKKTYPERLPFYLSEKSSGKNICQYAGMDKKEIDPTYKYPKLPER